MNLVPLEEWPEHPEHGVAVKRVIKVVMTYADNHKDRAESTEEVDPNTQECCGSGGGCNPLIDPLCG